MDGPLVFNAVLLFGGAFVLIASLRAWRAWKNFPPPSANEWEKDGERLGMFGAYGAGMILGTMMMMFGIGGLLK